MTSLSIIIPNLHSPRVGAVLAALRSQTALDHIREIIVVGQDRYGLVHPDALIRLIDTPRPTPAATARNLGAAQAGGDLLLFLDADCILAPDACARLIDGIAAGYDAVIGGVVPEPRGYWNLCNNIMTFPANVHGDRAGERPTLASFCLMLPKAVWQAVGGFDERYTVACEDMDLSFRMRRAGYRLGCVPQAAVYHRPNRATLADFWRNHAGYGFYWHGIRRRYAAMLPFSQASWATDRLGDAGAAAALPIAAAFVGRLLLSKPHLRRFWYAAPGMLLLRLAWYDGMRRAARRATADEPARAGGFRGNVAS